MIVIETTLQIDEINEHETLSNDMKHLHLLSNRKYKGWIGFRDEFHAILSQRVHDHV